VAQVAAVVATAAEHCKKLFENSQDGMQKNKIPVSLYAQHVINDSFHDSVIDWCFAVRIDKYNDANPIARKK